MRRICAVFITGIVLVGCATTRSTYAPDGRKAYTLNCSGLARGWDKCYSAAGDICGAADYDIVDRTGEDAAAGAVTRSGGGFARTQERSMVISCKNAP